MVSQNNEIMPLSDLPKGVYNVVRATQIDTPYGKSHIINLDDTRACFANKKLNTFIDKTKLQHFQFKNEGKSTFTSNGREI